MEKGIPSDKQHRENSLVLGQGCNTENGIAGSSKKIAGPNNVKK